MAFYFPQSPSQPHPLHQPTPGRLAEKARLVRMWYKVDELLVKPLLTHATPPLTKTLPKCCYPLALLLTSEEQLMNV
jgi:sodium/hydrogen exchanger-like protein 6/7